MKHGTYQVLYKRGGAMPQELRLDVVPELSLVMMKLVVVVVTVMSHAKDRIGMVPRMDHFDFH